jgi:multidrug efflux pump subunit AcrB
VGLAVLATPREEEPQISVPMIDVIAAMPGAPAARWRTCSPSDRAAMWEIPGVDYVYAMAGDGYAMVTVRFTVGEDQERASRRCTPSWQPAMDQAPPGALPPLVKPHTIDDVPILTLTLHSASYGSERAAQHRACTWRTRSARCPTWRRRSWWAGGRGRSRSSWTRRGWRRAA